MKTIITQDKANKAFGYPQLDSTKKVNINYIPIDEIVTSTNIGKTTYTFDVPSLNDTIYVTGSTNETFINFDGQITDNFSLVISPSETSSIGDKVYIFFNISQNVNITLGGNVSLYSCTEQISSYSSEIDIENYLILIYNGVSYVGRDFCK